MIHVILLSGGSGTRLWPLSTDEKPKQFLKVLPCSGEQDGSRESMVQRVFKQISNVCEKAPLDITVATGESQHDLLVDQLGDAHTFDIVLEPMRRDTAPAIFLAVEHLLAGKGCDPNDTVVVMPIDTYADQAYYDMIPLLAQAASRPDADIVLLGVEPSHPSEKYGYIIPESRDGDVWPVSTFEEKPTTEVAKSHIARGGLWNCGVFAFQLGYVDRIVEGYYKASSFEDLRAHYESLPKTSFDYAVVEKAERVAVIPYDGTWEDIGSWDVLTRHLTAASLTNSILDDCENVTAISNDGIPLIVSGISDATVVATSHGVLVLGKDASPDLKNLVAWLETEQ